MLQVFADRRHVGVQQRITPERRLIDVAIRQQRNHRLEEVGVLHPPGDLVEVERVDVLAVEIGDHLLVRAVLGHVIPRFGVELARLGHHVERERRRGGDQRFVPGHLHREVGEAAGQREVEEVIDGLGAVGFEVEDDGAGRSAAGQRQGPDRDLQQHRELLPRRRRIRHHHLAAVDGLNDELIGDELLEAFAVLVAVAVVGLVEVLIDKDGGVARRRGDGADFLVEGDRRAGRGEGHLAGVELGLVLAALEGQIGDGQGQQHLVQIAGGRGDVRREERRFAVVFGVVGPEGVDRHEVRELLLDRQVVIVVLGPFHRRLEMRVKLGRHLAASFGAIIAEEVRRRFRRRSPLPTAFRGILL